MPVSRKRSKRGGKQTRRHPAQANPFRTSPMRHRETDEELITRTRERFIGLAETEGHVFPAVKGYEPYGPPVECWTNAWVYSQATGLGYAEGITMMPDGWHAHAWCVTEDGAVIEPTLGYDVATEYRGWQLTVEGVAAVRALTHEDGPRTSFLEAGLASGVATWDEIRDRFCAVPGTI